MRLHTWRIILISLLLVNCSSGVTIDNPNLMEASQFETIKNIQYKVWIDETFTYVQRKEIIKAINHWNFVLNGQITFSIEGFVEIKNNLKTNKEFIVPDYWIINVDNSNRYIQELDEKFEKAGKQLSTIGFANNIGGDKIYLNTERLDQDQIKTVCEHELGHILGLEHQKTGLMSAKITKFPCIDSGIMMNIAKNFELNPKYLKWTCPR